ncbi:MAG: 23S rRNA (uracil(1939)-C(5))-methyltransferase RlmD, partial [Faecousia sp.]
IAAKLEAEGLRPDVITVDPPRKGLAPEVIASVAAMGPRRVVYVSCDPATLGRDVKIFRELGYQPARACAVDMFPGTRHVETVCQLILRKPVVHVNIDVDVEELVQDKRGLATYEQIKAYVLEHTGLKVSSLYIAQVKQKCGIIERENYNKPKSEDAKQPQCPPEKEEAIKKALKHFGMI